MPRNDWKTSCIEAREMDLVSYLFTLGYAPAKINHADYWYCSPFRDEKTPSFKVNRKLNRWYDHGVGKGGNLIDFAILYNNCTVGEFLKSFQKEIPHHPPMPSALPKEQTNTDRRIQIVKTGPIVSFHLERYLHQRRIPMALANQYCQEVRYTLSGNPYMAIGFPNQSGGYELRNAFFKGTAAPKDITLLDNKAPEIAVFEGFFDFLSFMAMGLQQHLGQSNFLILNSIALFEKARPHLECHQAIHLYLDRDAAGQHCTSQAIASGKKYRDQSSLYGQYKDLNDWLMHMGKALNPPTDHLKHKRTIKLK